MTIPEACQLILQASVISKDGEIFVLNMGEPVKIAYMAEQMIRLSGKIPGEDIEIVYTGLRPGEKLYEELFHDSERLADTGYPKILRAELRKVDGPAFESALVQLEEACRAADEAKIAKLLRSLVPEHKAETAAARAVVYPWKKSAPKGSKK